MPQCRIGLLSANTLKNVKKDGKNERKQAEKWDGPSVNADNFGARDNLNSQGLSRRKCIGNCTGKCEVIAENGAMS
jgi:hypothetical protein